MSKILELAKTFEESSKQQASDIETSVKNAFEPHERAILAALESSAQRLNTAIDAQNRRWGWLVLKGWVFPLIGVAFLLGISWVVVWYQGRVIAENWNTITRQERVLKGMESWGLSLYQDQNGQFIVLPDGMTATAGWSKDNGKTNLVKLEKPEE
ncbi:MbeB family mobilization protein [Aeromonas veronii]|uniref:MbeB family mobilization protein n=1 Tax=Aeromonas veronii TaxID=654 RepID=UPI0022462868|nr:MbeB family mobilization protein [Aeromonas veronii]MCX0424833.1 MbeB family mobilization protein [Aeromonas veronii]